LINGPDIQTDSDISGIRRNIDSMVQVRDQNDKKVYINPRHVVAVYVN
jgi:hypothetical protein